MISRGVIEEKKYHLDFFILIVTYIAIFAITCWYLSYYRNMLYSLSADEGIFMYGAKRVLEGQIIYRDFFSYFFPGNYYLLALIYKLFGYSFLVARGALVIIDSLINVIVFYLSYKTLRAWYAILPPLFFLILGFPNWMQFSHFWNGDLFLLLSLICLLWYLEARRSPYLYGAALLLGVTALFQQADGFYGAIVVAVILLIKDRVAKPSFYPSLDGRDEGRVKKLYQLKVRSLILFDIVAFIPLAAMFGYITVQGGLGDFIRQQLFIVLKVYPNVAAFSPFLFIFNKAYPFNILIGIYFFGSIAAGIFLVAFHKRVSNTVIITIAGNLILLLTISYSLDLEHIATAMPLFLMLVLLPVKYALSYAKEHKRNFFKPLYYVSGIAGICLLAWGGSSIFSNIKRIETRSYPININGTKLWTFDEQKAEHIQSFMNNVPSILQDHRDVFVYPYAPLIYVMMHYTNPTRYDFIYIQLGIEGANAYVLRDIMNELQQKHVQYLIKHGWPQRYTRMLMSLKHITPYPNVLDSFVQSRYTELWTIGEYSVLQIRSIP